MATDLYTKLDAALAVLAARGKDAPRRAGGKARVTYRGLTFAGYNQPRPASPGDKHKYVVLARQGGRIRLVRFGLRGYSDYLKHRDPERRRSFKARHRCAAKTDKLTAGWWACNYNW